MPCEYAGLVDFNPDSEQTRHVSVRLVRDEIVHDTAINAELPRRRQTVREKTRAVLSDTRVVVQEFGNGTWRRREIGAAGGQREAWL